MAKRTATKKAKQTAMRKATTTATPKKATPRKVTPAKAQPSAAEPVAAPIQPVEPGPDDVNGRRRGLDPSACGGPLLDRE